MGSLLISVCGVGVVSICPAPSLLLSRRPLASSVSSSACLLGPASVRGPVPARVEEHPGARGGGGQEGQGQCRRQDGRRPLPTPPGDVHPGAEGLPKRTFPRKKRDAHPTLLQGPRGLPPPRAAPLLRVPEPNHSTRGCSARPITSRSMGGSAQSATATTTIGLPSTLRVMDCDLAPFLFSGPLGRGDGDRARRGDRRR